MKGGCIINTLCIYHTREKMKRIVFLLVIVFSLVGCSSVIERWNPHRIFKDDAKVIANSVDDMTNSKYNLEEKVEKNF